MRKAKKVHRYLSLFFMIVWITGLFTGCAESGSKAPIEYQVELETPPEPTDKLVIYQPPDMAQMLTFVLPIYKAKFPDVKVEVRSFATEQDYRTILSSELMAGQGPDVVLWCNYPQSDLRGSEFNDIYKVMNSGVFYNLDNFIVNDSDFDMADYNEAVLDMGVYKGQRQYVPISYGASIWITSEETLARNQITLSEEPTFREFSEQITDYCERNEDNEDNWLLFQYPIPKGVRLLYPHNGLNMVDYEQENINTDSEAFKQTMETYKRMHKMVNRSEEGVKFPFEINTGFSERGMQAGQILFQPAIESNTLWYAGESAALLTTLEETPRWVGIPNVNGGKTTAFSRQNAAINKAGENKANAYEFIKVMLSKTIQSDCSYASIYTDIPVHNEARKEKIVIKGEADAERSWSGVDIIATPLSEAQMEKLYDVFTDVEPIKNYAVTQDEILWKNMLPYFEGTASYEECVKNLENELKLYVAE